MSEVNFSIIGNQLNCTRDLVHALNVKAGWWNDLKSGADLHPDPEHPEKAGRNVAELLCLVHSEISEAMEAHRKGLLDDKLPHRAGIEVELADALIRIFDIAGGLSLDLGGAFAEKLAYNQTRADHKPENRIKGGGKSY